MLENEDSGIAVFFNSCSGLVAQIPSRKGRSITGRDYHDQLMKKR